MKTGDLQQRIKAAAYIRSATDPVSENQITDVQKYADDNGFEIIKIYVDSGETKNQKDTKPKLTQMLDDIKNRKNDYTAVILRDCVRWGRTQNFELVEHYEQLCKLGGVQVVYVNDHKNRKDFI